MDVWLQILAEPSYIDEIAMFSWFTYFDSVLFYSAIKKRWYLSCLSLLPPPALARPNSESNASLLTQRERHLTIILPTYWICHCLRLLVRPLTSTPKMIAWDFRPICSGALTLEHGYQRRIQNMAATCHGASSPTMVMA